MTLGVKTSWVSLSGIIKIVFGYRMVFAVEGHVKMCCLNGWRPFGNLFENSIDEIRNNDEYRKVKKGCDDQPTDHCRNCSYKELVPILSHLQS